MGCGASASPGGGGAQPLQPAAGPAASAKKDQKVCKVEIEGFLQGIGVRDVAKATQALKDAGIESRNDFFSLDKDQRQELDGELKSAGVTLGDRGKIKKAEDTGVTIQQGNGKVEVLMLQPGQAMQTSSSLIRVFLGLGWEDKHQSKSIDVDASCIGFNSGNPEEVIYFGKLGNQSKSLKHTGDILTGKKDPKAKELADLERIYVWLPNIPANIDCLVFVANVYTSGADFGDLASAYIRMVNADTNQELARLSLAGSGLKGNGLVFAKVYRCGAKGPWHFHTLGMPLQVPGCTSVEAMMPQLQSTGCAYSPPAALALSDGPGKANPAAGGAASSAAVPSGAAPAAPKKSQTPTGVYVAAGLAVATVGGIAAATAIFMNSDISLDNFAPDLFEGGVDFASLVPDGDAITGIGEGIADGAGDAYEWAGGVVESVDLGSVGDGLGDAVGAVGEGLGSAGEAIGGLASGAAGAIGDAAPGAIDAMGGAAAGAGDALGSAAGAVGGVAGDAGGAIAEGAGAAAGGIGSAFGSIDVGDAFEKVGDAIGCIAKLFD